MHLKKIVAYFLISSCLFFIVNAGYAQLPLADTIATPQGKIIIQPVYHGALVLTLGDKTIFVDPYNGISAYKHIARPDFILITDIHQDHLDTVTINALNTTDARFIAPRAVADRLPEKHRLHTTVLANGEKVVLPGISIIAVPMYNLPEDAGSRHPRGRGNGYLLEYGGKRIYISGDTEDIQEMRELKNVDLAFVCMNQPFTMTVEQAASAVLEFKPSIVYPYHYRDMNGFSDVKEFKKIVEQNNSNTEVRIRNWYSKILAVNQVTKIENVVYGNAAGACLTMDVYKPAHSNKIGIVTIPGSAFGYAYSSEYSQPSMTTNFSADSFYFGKYARMLVDRGYTIFVINHRFAPQFHYTDILGDCQRAVRYVRFNAEKYGIDPYNIGAFGYSSGATLCAMLGVTDADRNTAQTGLDTVSSKVQSVVTLAARFDLSDFNKQADTAIQNPVISRVLLNYVGELPMIENGVYVLKGRYAAASPVSYIDKADASFLIYCSCDDPLIPHRQATNMHQKLLNNGVDAKLHISKNEGHNPIPDIEEIDYWFLRHLKTTMH